MLKKIYGVLLRILSFFLGACKVKEIDTLIRFGRKLNIKKPENLAEKILNIELVHRPNLYAVCTDKIAVRDYVINKGYASILVPLCGGPWTNIEEINFDLLPESYVLKATHGCKMNYFVKDSSLLNLKKCKKEVARWLKTTYGYYSMELHYVDIPHRIYAEEFLPDADNIIDYKFNCINGKPEFVFVVSNRKSNGDKRMSMTMNTFDMNWNYIDKMVPSGMEIPGDGNIPKPEHFEEMKKIAEDLSKDFDFVRVDLFDLGGKVFFGELTFTPACGVLPFYKEDFLLEMGKKLELRKCMENR